MGSSMRCTSGRATPRFISRQMHSTVALGSPPDALPEDVELSVDGVVLDDSTPLSGAAPVSQGCSIDVALTGARFVEVLQHHDNPYESDVDMSDHTCLGTGSA